MVDIDDPTMLPTSLTEDLLTDAGKYKLARICEILGLQKADFAELTGRTVESVAALFRNNPVKPRDNRTQTVLKELIQLIVIFRAMNMDAGVARWMSTPIASYSGRTPRDIIANEDGPQLIARLLTVATGNIGA